MTRQFFILIFVLIGSIMTAQSVAVQTFDFKSSTRDTVVEFPDDGKRYEKILMHYGMRCKGGLVSTGANRNRGCGEWDYSCNTYVVDSTRVDSLKQIGPEYVISGLQGTAGDLFSFTNSPTYTYFQRIEKDVTNMVGVPSLVPVVGSLESSDFPFGQAATPSSYSFILHADELSLKGLYAGPISGLQFPITSTGISFEGLKIRLQAVEETDLSQGLAQDDWQEVYHSLTELSTNNAHLIFHTPFQWDGTSNLAVNIVHGKRSGQMLPLDGENKNYEALIYNSNAYSSYSDFGTAGHINITSGLEEIANEVTISYWQKGDDVLPVNSTILEAKDAADLRQINIHHPWSNSQIYWDCGNDGTGYDRINKPAVFENYKGQWNHWAFTKNANTGSMKIYLNGELWHEGTDKFKPIDAMEMNLGAGINNLASRSHTKMSEFRIWKKELDETTIKSWMRKTLSDQHPAYDDLIVYFSLEDYNGDAMSDLSGNDNHGIIEGQLPIIEWRIGEAVMSSEVSNFVPAHSFDQGSYTLEVQDRVVIDSVQNIPNSVEHYIVDENNDRVLESTELLYVFDDEGLPVYNDEDEIVARVPLQPEGELIYNDLNYYSKQPMSFELLSFVTPYGINLDLGLEGESWTFDVTDFSPILKGNKRIYMSRGGQWQEEMDIWFEFIEGIPDRDVINIDQVWPVTGAGPAAINDDFRFEPRLVKNYSEAEEFVLKTTVTGHRQGGEFDPRSHRMLIDVFTDTWNITNECADNPVYPQGGTWIFDRQGWCPGAASSTREFIVTDFVKFLDSLAIVNYSVVNPPTESNYIVNTQIVAYGPMNKTIDLAVIDIINPSNKIEHRRHNPNCNAPKIVIKNHGSEKVTSALIKYGIVGKQDYYYRLTEGISSLKTQEVVLPYINDALVAEDGDVFFATVMEVNDQVDTYPNNDTYTTEIQGAMDHFASNILVEFRTNKRGQQTQYKVVDSYGEVVLRKNAGLSSNTIYRDTLKGLNGCYQLLIEDSGENGLEFWFPTDPAANDGAGSFRFIGFDGKIKNIDPDFGKYSEYNFTAGMVSDIEELEEVTNGFQLFPNPTDGAVFFSSLDGWEHQLELKVMDQVGRQLSAESTNKHQIVGGLEFLNKLRAGVYYIQLSDKYKTSTKKLVKI